MKDDKIEILSVIHGARLLLDESKWRGPKSLSVVCLEIGCRFIFCQFQQLI